MRRGGRPDPCLSHVAAWIAETGRRLDPDREMAARFLTCLDPRAPGFSFRTFSDTAYTRQGGEDPLERALHGALDSCWEVLVELNRKGAAVAVTVNQTDGRGRAVQDVRRVRALFLDDDRGVAPTAFNPPPQMQVITSAGHSHYYWLVADVEMAQFSGYQQRLAGRFGGDGRVFALNQAMQLPGFWRRKNITRPRLPRLVLHHSGAAFPVRALQGLLGDSPK